LNGVSEIAIPGLEIEDELGRGPYSVVYRGRRGPHACAVKVARRSGRVSQWFRREAAALARVKHPGIPRVLDVGDADGRPYLVMELIEGESLATRFQRGPLALNDAIHLGRELVDIIEAVHARGLVHRDIKPRNILLEPHGRLRLVDFGLVTQLRPILGLATGPNPQSYVAPEQQRNPQLADARADLYSVGRILEHAIASEERATEPIATLLSHLCAEDPSTRYASARHVRSALEQVARGEVPPRPSCTVARLDEPLPLVGQDAQLRRIRHLEHQALTGHGGMVLIQGAAGSGKSRFLREVIAGGRDELLYLSASARSTTPLHTVRALIEAFLDSSSARDPYEVRLEQLRQAIPGPTLAILGRLSERLRQSLTPTDLPTDREHAAFPEATSDLLLGLARSQGGLAICVDDLEQLDPLSREVLVRAALGATHVPLLLLCTARNDPSPVLTRFVNALGTEKLTRLSLSPLGEEGVEVILRDYLGETRLDPEMVERVAGLSDGTPLSVLEVAGSLIDGGALWPQWGSWRFDPPRLRQIPLPRGSLALLERRLNQLPEHVVRVLEAIAVSAPLFDPERLAQMLRITTEDIQLTLVEARGAGLVEHVEGRPRFVHATVREALLSRLGPEATAELHRRAAVTWEDANDSDIEVLYAIAEHYEQGGLAHDPSAAFRAAQRAAFRAAAQLDHEGAIRFFEIGLQCIEHLDGPLSPAFFRAMAESQISIGDYDGSLENLGRALPLCRGVERAEILARQAWVYELKTDPARAWQILDAAFSELGDSMPTESPVKLATALFETLQNALNRGDRGREEQQQRRKRELLCQLHHQNARLGIEYNKPLRVLVSARSLQTLAHRMAPSSSVARTRAIYGALMTVVGRQRAGAAALAEAMAMAKQLQQPSTVADVCQADFVAKVWGGQWHRALELAEQCLDVYGHWLNVWDFAGVAISARAMESVRGRPAEALAWLDRAYRRVSRYSRMPAVQPHMLVHSRLAELSVLGRERDEGCHVAGTTSEPIRGLCRIASWAPRALVAANEPTRDALRELVQEFEGEGHSPARAHLLLAEYYLVVAYARGDDCLRASSSTLHDDLERYEAALSDYRKIARVAAFKAHLKALEGLLALLHGDHTKARERLAQAKELGEQETAPWVLYSVARYEAHILRREGRNGAALDRAKVAALIAQDYGAKVRLARVREEFGLPNEEASALKPGLLEDARAIARRQLNSLLRATEGAPDLRTQSRLALCEILVAIGGTRGLLSFELEPSPPLLVALTNQGHDWHATDPRYQALLAHVQHGSDEELYEDPRVLITPLHLADQRIGSLVIERDVSEPAYSRPEVEQLMMLAAQLPMALELTRRLEDRERVEQRLRQELRMDAMRELAGSTGNDLNNTMTAMFAAVEDLDDDALSHRAGSTRHRAESLSVIRDALRRSADLTRQLLTFSGRQLLDTRVIDVRQAVADVVPLIQRILGNDFELRLRMPGNAPLLLRTDRALLEQAIVNLAINARDAMPGGGAIDVTVAQTDVEGAGPHVTIALRDSGAGIAPELHRRIFEPFFTTKPKGSGTGLGLASIFGFVKQSDGFVDVQSVPGEGSTFTLYFPYNEEPVPDKARPRETERGDADAMTSGVVLLIEEERVLRNAVTSSLQRVGYWVMTASDLLEALEIIRAGGPVDLIIANVRWRMGQLDLEQELEATGLHIPLLYMGAAPANHDAVAHAGDWVDFIQPPFEHGELLDKVRGLLRH